ncbi:hypothetical protein GJ744_010492 [Endocarpon pusillum]|uniref:Nephrocystin 3-like N-terminal domain-containing protein n=1 Tax=Endocarpon pusillum TaxID=364733 RepID=A0A8H7E440_9EURO|nr:hypothetical protein GJ744_010492 [Endocarpon pusillum]
MHKELEETKNSLLEFRERKTDEFFKLDTAKPEERAVVQRWNQYLPSLAAVRGIAMTAAALDPHKIAPIVCACVFFSIDLAFNNLSPETKGKMRNILFESVIAINEWMSFETNFRKTDYDAIKDEVKELQALLTGQYLQALRLLCDILLSRNGSWEKRAGDKMTNKILDFDLRLATLKDHKLRWASKKKVMEETLVGEKEIADILGWIKKKDDPEKSLRDIRVKISSKRILWVNGPYGTGKTTIIYRIVSELQSLSENYLRREQSETPGDEGQLDRLLQVIPYFCTVLTTRSERADYSTIIRALTRKISLMPDFTLARRAETFHGQYTRVSEEPGDITIWEKFLHSVFFKKGCDDLRESLKQSLIDHADGMYE